MNENTSNAAASNAATPQVFSVCVPSEGAGEKKNLTNQPQTIPKTLMIPGFFPAEKSSKHKALAERTARTLHRSSEGCVDTSAGREQSMAKLKRYRFGRPSKCCLEPRCCQGRQCGVPGRRDAAELSDTEAEPLCLLPKQGPPLCPLRCPTGNLLFEGCGGLGEQQGTQVTRLRQISLLTAAHS